MKATPRLVRRVPAEVAGWPGTVPPLLARLYAARGATSVEQAQPKLANLLSPELLGGMSGAIALLSDAIDTGRHIVVVGDFDCAI